MVKNEDGTVELRNPTTNETRRIPASRQGTDIDHGVATLSYDATEALGWVVDEDSFEAN